MSDEVVSELAKTAAREWYTSVDEVLVNNVFAKPGHRQALEDGIEGLAAIIQRAIEPLERETWNKAIAVVLYDLGGEMDHKKYEFRNTVITALEQAREGKET